MKITLTFTLSLISLTIFAQTTNWEDWESASRQDHRLLPKYGMIVKTASQKEADDKFIEAVMAQPDFQNNYRAASDHLIQFGISS